MQVEKRKLRRTLAELEHIKGRHTELVSVYIPVGYDLNKIIQHLAQEQGTATNIKDARTRKNVIDSLEKAIRYLRTYKKTPEKGLAVFAGDASENESKIDIRVWGILPPEPIISRIYRCDQTFLIHPLHEMLEHREVFGLLVLDKREATLGLLRGTKITSVAHLTSGVPGKIRAGGQSAQRFDRLREGAAKEFYKRIAEVCNKQFLVIKTELKGILIGGPIPTKEEFFDGNYLNDELKRKVIGLKDLGDTDEAGLHDLVTRSQDVLAKELVIEEKKIMEEFFDMLAKHPEKTAYGKREVEKAIDLAAVATLLLSDSLPDDVVDDLGARAEAIGSVVKIISIDTREGIQLKDLGGCGAILRYAVS
ncbi:MAG: peptide chain release factor aRF-1 [Nanoarchaeota archaeon]